LAIYENEKISVYGSIQCPYYVKNALIAAFGWENDRIRIVPTTVGGAFGGKEDYPSLIAGHAAFAAFKTGKPVQLVFDRSEDIEVTPKRHPSVIKLKAALDEDNQIIALEADIRLNAGAYSGLSNVVLQRTMFNIAGVYHIPSLKVKGRAVATNTVPSGAFRGFGAPQAIFAIEMHMNLIAEKLNIDPLDFKVKHMAQKDDSTATGGTYRQDIILPELIETVDNMSGYRRKVEEFARQKDNGWKGIGLSLFLHGCGFTGSGERDHIKATVKLRKLTCGKVEILVANVDMGQGLRTTLKKIVAKVLDLPMADIVYENPDTDRVPDSGPTVASRTVMIVGKLLEEAAIKLKSIKNESGEIEVTQKYLHPTDIVWDDTKFAGDAYPAYSWGVNAVEVEVDPLTYEIEVKGVWTAFDIGKAIDDRIIQGQLEGGILQGLGWGTIEVMECKQGKIQQRTVTDYIIPTSMDFAKIESRLIDNPYEKGPFGAKGAGELFLIGAAPALAAAVSNALGVPIQRLPVTPEYLMEVIKNGKTN
jgi:CO/xanthine dehydrogenase Mo-binding subunit